MKHKRKRKLAAKYSRSRVFARAKQNNPNMFEAPKRSEQNEHSEKMGEPHVQT